MNLLVKKLGLVVLPALFFACEEPTELGADLNPNSGAVSAHYVEIPVSTTLISSDSLLTSQRVVLDYRGNISLYPSPFYIGRVENEDFGTVKASLYSNLAKPDTSDFLKNVTAFDSVKLQLVWDNNSVYGDNIGAPQHYYVHQLASPIAKTGSRIVERDGQDAEVLAYNYYAANREALGPQLGQMTLHLSDKIANRIDTSALSSAGSRTLSTKLPADFASSLYARFKADATENNYANGVFGSQEAFDEFIKGIAVVPDENNSFLTSVSLSEQASGLIIYYHQGVIQKSLRIPFTPSWTQTRGYDSYPVYFGVEADRSGTGLQNAPGAGHLFAFDAADDRVYFQGLSGIYPKVDFSAFKEFVAEQEVDGRIVINRAVIEFDSVVAGSGKRQPLPQSMEFYFVENGNKRFASPTLGGLERALSTAGRTYKIGQTNVNVIQSDIVYNLEQFMRRGEDRLLRGVLYPTDGYFLRPENFVIRPDQVKLKVWYTKLKGSDL